MADGWLIVWVLTAIFSARLIRSAFGFGEALIAVPLLALVMPVEIAAPLAVLVSITVAAVILLEDWHRVQLASAWRLVLSTLLGIPLGLLLLTAVPGPAVKASLAVIIIAFSAYSLARRLPLELHDDRWAWLFGFGAGVLRGAYGMNGPPLVGMAGYGLAGPWFLRYLHVALALVGLTLLVQSVLLIRPVL
jgi:uncharacterized membrane protein YfcA